MKWKIHATKKEDKLDMEISLWVIHDIFKNREQYGIHWVTKKANEITTYGHESLNEKMKSLIPGKMMVLKCLRVNEESRGM